MCASSAHPQECLTSHLSLRKKNEKEAKNHSQMEETVIKKVTKKQSNQNGKNSFTFCEE